MAKAVLLDYLSVGLVTSNATLFLRHWLGLPVEVLLALAVGLLPMPLGVGGRRGTTR